MKSVPVTDLEKRVFSMLKQLRVDRGLTFEEVSDRTGISTSTLNRFEKGKMHAQLYIIEPLCQAYGVGIDELLTSDPPTYQADPQIDDFEAESLRRMQRAVRAKRPTELVRTMSGLMSYWESSSS